MPSYALIREGVWWTGGGPARRLWYALGRLRRVDPRACDEDKILQVLPASNIDCLLVVKNVMFLAALSKVAKSGY